MVDVTKDNFAAELTRFEAAVADPLLVFIAFDFEMTGIGPPGASFAEFHDYADSPAERYAKLREVVKRYRACQLGVALFHRRPSSSSAAGSSGSEDLVCSVWNMPLFDSVQDTVISPSSITFLAKNGFDLSAWVLNGISTVNSEGKAHLLKELAQKVAVLEQEEALEEGALGAAADGSSSESAVGVGAARQSDMCLDKEEDRAAAADALAKLDEWLASLEGAEEGEGAAAAVAVAEEEDDDAPPELLLPPLEWAGIRRYVYQEIEVNPKYRGLVTEKRGRSTIAVLRPSLRQRRRRREAEKQRLRTQTDRKIGARYVFEAMSRACRGDGGVGAAIGAEAPAAGGGVRGPVPLVGHNCLADLAFLFSTFADIPESYERFKASVHDAFPVILDTKHVAAFGASANWWQWSNTALEALYTELLPSADASAGAAASSSTSSSSSAHRSFHYLPPNPIHISFGESFDRYKEGPDGVQRFHEAGWDAYCTGCVLTRLAEKTLSWSAHTTGIRTMRKRRRGDGDHDDDAAAAAADAAADVDAADAAADVDTAGSSGDRKRLRKTKSGGKVSVVESTRGKNPTMKKPSDDTFVSISAVSAMSQLISPRKMPKKKGKAAPETTESAAPVGEYGILCELPFNELNLMRSPFVIKLGQESDIRRDGSTSELPQKEAKAVASSDTTGTKSGAAATTQKTGGIGSRLKKALGLASAGEASSSKGVAAAAAAPAAATSGAKRKKTTTTDSQPESVSQLGEDPEIVSY